MKLPDLRSYISVPDYPPHCPICNERAILIGDFTHTNFKGALYNCPSGDVTHRFVDQEDDYFSIDYWNMNEKERTIYETMNTVERRVFLSMRQQEKETFLKLGKRKRTLYLDENYKAVIDEYESYLTSEFYVYDIYEQ